MAKIIEVEDGDTLVVRIPDPSVMWRVQRAGQEITRWFPGVHLVFLPPGVEFEVIGAT